MTPETARRKAGGHRAAAHTTPSPAAPYARYRAQAVREAKETGEWPLSEEELCRRAHQLAMARSYEMVAGRLKKEARRKAGKAARKPAMTPEAEETLKARVEAMEADIARLTGRISLLEQVDRQEVNP